MRYTARTRDIFTYNEIKVQRKIQKEIIHAINVYECLPTELLQHPSMYCFHPYETPHVAPNSTTHMGTNVTANRRLTGSRGSVSCFCAVR